MIHRAMILFSPRREGGKKYVPGVFGIHRLHGARLGCWKLTHEMQEL
jgi:hypothetical protein